MRSAFPGMKIIIAPDSFKGSLSSVDAALAIENGIRKALFEAEIVKVPMADGGEGTVEAMICAIGGEKRRMTVIGPLGEEVSALYGVSADGVTAVIEMAAASGLPLVPDHKRNPMLATTYGTGQLIQRALDDGCRKIIIGLGGSATNDGGMGMAQALGIRFLDKEGVDLGRGGMELEKVAVIDLNNLDPRIIDTEFVAMCDVSNPLFGENGAAAVYGPQKGATSDMIERLDHGMEHYAAILKQQLSVDIAHLPGAGAAGGLGAGLVAYLGATLRPGIETVLLATKLEKDMVDASLLFTGEGRTDRQTTFGKVPAGLAAIARKYDVPVVCLSGALDKGAEELYVGGITSLFSIVNAPMPLTEAMERTEELLAQSAENVVRLIASVSLDWSGTRRV